MVRTEPVQSSTDNNKRELIRSQGHRPEPHPRDGHLRTAKAHDLPEIRRALAVLCQPGDVVELRALDVGGKTVAGYFDDHIKLAEVAAKYSGQAAGVYVVLNTITLALLARSANRVTIGPKNLTQDKDIVRRRYLPIDVDAKRPSGISSTDAEHDAAIQVAGKIKEYLTGLGFPTNSIIVGDSGNGAHLLARVDLPNDEDSTNLIKTCLGALATRLDDDAVSIDPGVFNAARIWKLPGTLARKGDSTPDRPHRLATLLDVPATLVIAPIEALRALAATLPAKPKETPPTRPYHGPAHPFDLVAWMSAHGIEVRSSDPYQGGTRYILKECPFNPEHTGTSVAIIQGGNGRIGFKCQHAGCADKKWRDLREAQEILDQTLPTIQVNNRQLRNVTSEALEILEKANRPEFLFVRAGGLTRITWDEEGYPIIELVSESALRGYMTRAANFIKIKKGKEETEITAVPPPLDVARDILSLGQWSLPPLQGIIQAPVIREDGTILIEPGYDAATKLYYMPIPELKIPEIPDSPTHEDALKAMALLMEVICDFPFDSDASKANALGVVITPILRPLIVGKVPMALFDKPQPGTGASLLAEVVDTIATGRSSAISPLKDDEAWRKEIASILLRGQRTVIIDNVERKLYAASLGSLLTSDYWEFRILGHNQEVAIPHRCVWIATGNNIQVGGDLPRRCYWVRLDAKQARPWERDRKRFKHPELIKWVREERGLIIAAVLAIGRAWFLAGQPQGQKNLGSYEEWTGIIGGILDYVGVSGFLDNLNLMYDITDVDTPQWEDFLAVWFTILGAVPVTVAEVVRALDDYGDFAVRLPDDLVDYYKDKDGNLAKGFTRRLGKALAKRNGVHYPRGYFLEKCGEKGRAICWKVDNQGAAKNEFSEFNEFPSTPHTENLKGKYIYKGETNSQNSLNSSTPGSDLEQVLGTTIEQALAIWDKQGRPVIHLGLGENCLDLAKLLGQRAIKQQHLSAIKEWLEQHSK